MITERSGSRSFGYARVSSSFQSLQRQLDALKAYGLVERDIVTDKASGKDFDRSGYTALKSQMLRSGDYLVITELDRIGRNYEMVKAEFQSLTQMGVSIVVLENPTLSTADKSDLERTLICNIIFELLAYLTEKERLKIKSRQAAGIKAAKESGLVKFGRPRGYTLPSGWAVETAAWRRGEQTAVTTMSKLGLKKTAFYKYVAEEGV